MSLNVTTIRVQIDILLLYIHVIRVHIVNSLSVVPLNLKYVCTNLNLKYTNIELTYRYHVFENTLSNKLTVSRFRCLFCYSKTKIKQQQLIETIISIERNQGSVECGYSWPRVLYVLYTSETLN